MNPSLREIISAIEEKARPEWQLDFDNTGWQILLPGKIDTECTGVLLCVDVTPFIVNEAKDRICNLIISHHPLLFKAIKRIDSKDRVGETIIRSIEEKISVYACHTSIDSAPGGVSHKLASILNLKNVEILDESAFPGVGIGIVGEPATPLTFGELVKVVKEEMKSPVARCSGILDLNKEIKRVAIGGGACGDMIPLAVNKGADVMITSDVKHNQFIDHDGKIGIIDLGHYETEQCTKEIFYKIITEKFPNFVPYYSNAEKNPITYL